MLVLGGPERCNLLAKQLHAPAASMGTPHAQAYSHPAAICVTCSDLLVTSETTNRTARLHFTNYNQQGYQFVCATQRAYWLHWDTPVAINPDVYSLHDLDLLNATAGWVHMVTKWPQVGHGVRSRQASTMSIG